MSLRDYELLRAATLEEEVRGLVYLSGPMTHLPFYNWPAFHEAAATLRERGYPVISPAELDVVRGIEPPADGAPPPGDQLDGLLAEDIRHVTNCDLVVCLPGWEDSGGATFEVAVAVRLGKPVYAYGSQCATLVSMDLHTVIAVCHATKLYGRHR